MYICSLKPKIIINLSSIFQFFGSIDWIAVFVKFCEAFAEFFKKQLREWTEIYWWNKKWERKCPKKRPVINKSFGLEKTCWACAWQCRLHLWTLWMWSNKRKNLETAYCSWRTNMWSVWGSVLEKLATWSASVVCSWQECERCGIVVVNIGDLKNNL